MVAYLLLARGHDDLLHWPETLYSLRQNVWTSLSLLIVALKEQNWWLITCHIISSCCILHWAAAAWECVSAAQPISRLVVAFVLVSVTLCTLRVYSLCFLCTSEVCWIYWTRRRYPSRRRSNKLCKCRGTRKNGLHALYSEAPTQKPRTHSFQVGMSRPYIRLY